MIGAACRYALLAAGCLERRLSIVLFHRVLAEPDALLIDEPDVRRFTEQLLWLRGSFTIMPLRAAVSHLFAGTLPRAALCITFDDGYRDNAQNALPVLQQLGLPATFFVTTRYENGGMMWNDRVVEAVRAWPGKTIELDDLDLGINSLDGGRGACLDALLGRLKYLDFDRREEITTEILRRSGSPSARLMMDAADIGRLHAAGMEIGGHTVSHPILARLNSAAASRQIADNKSRLEAIVGEPLVTFAYPNGQPQQDFDARHLGMLRDCGYRYALTTSTGTATASTHPLQLPRFTPWDRQRTKYMGRMLGNYFSRARQVDDIVIG